MEQLMDFLPCTKAPEYQGQNYEGYIAPYNLCAQIAPPELRC
jgi:hypothetical protein